MTLSESQLASIEQNPYRQDFPLLAKHPDITFLDSAATSQRPEAVLAAERGFYETMNANPLRGLYRLSVERPPPSKARVGASPASSEPRMTPVSHKATRSSSRGTPPSPSTSWQAPSDARS